VQPGNEDLHELSKVPCSSVHTLSMETMSEPSISSVSRIPNILEYLREPLQSGLGDRSAYVRKTAVMGTVKIFNVAPEFVSR